MSEGRLYSYTTRTVPSLSKTDEKPSALTLSVMEDVVDGRMVMSLNY